MAEMKVLVASILAVSAVAVASPAYSLGGLLVRAETVAVVQLDTSDPHGATFHADRLFRGRFDRGTRLDIAPDKLPPHVTRFVAVSQGDKHFGPPTADAQIGQGTAGQRGFRGWLLYPVRRVHGHDVVDPELLIKDDGEVHIDRLGKLVAKHRYRATGE